MTFIPLGLNPHNGIQIDVDARIFLRHGGPGGAECWGVDGSTPWLEGIEAIVLRTDLTLRKEILWESERATDAEVHAMEMKLNRENGTNDRPSATTSYRSGVRVDGCSREASDEQACQGTLGLPEP
jgi:hypothetical protein